MEEDVFKESAVMPKMKTKRGAAKRFKTTGNGKIIRSKAFGSHILTSKTTKRKRRLRKSVVVDPANARGLRRMMPYG
jgi:large subunit ribosomal protein L35